MTRLGCAAALIAALAAACDRVVDLTPQRDAQPPVDAPLFGDGGIVLDDGGFLPDARPPDAQALPDASGPIEPPVHRRHR